MVSQNSYSFFPGFFDLQNIKKIIACWIYLLLLHWNFTLNTNITIYLCIWKLLLEFFIAQRFILVWNLCWYMFMVETLQLGKFLSHRADVFSFIKSTKILQFFSSAKPALVQLWKLLFSCILKKQGVALNSFSQNTTF